MLKKLIINKIMIFFYKKTFPGKQFVQDNQQKINYA